MIWNTYSDHEVHTYNDRYANSDLTDLYNRCVLFLESDGEYRWPQGEFANLGATPRLSELLTFGLFGDASGARHKEFMKGLAQSGDFAVWPFIRQTDYAANLRDGQRDTSV